MIQIIVMRAFGGPIILFVPAPTPPPVNCTMLARKGNVTLYGRKQ